MTFFLFIFLHTFVRLLYFPIFSFRFFTGFLCYFYFYRNKRDFVFHFLHSPIILCFDFWLAFIFYLFPSSLFFFLLLMLYIFLLIYHEISLFCILHITRFHQILTLSENFLFLSFTLCIFSIWSILFSFVLFFFNFCNTYLCVSFWFSHVFSISFAPQFRTDFSILSYFPILFPALVPLKAEEIIHWLSNDQYNCRRLILEEKTVPSKQQYQKSTEDFEGINGHCIAAINIDFVDENMVDFCPPYWEKSDIGWVKFWWK